MLPSIHHASTEQTASDRPDLTLYASLEQPGLSPACCPKGTGCRSIRHQAATVARCSACWSACGRGLSN